jgi:hypothetical protein
MRSELGSTVTAALASMPRCFVERSTGSVNLGGISLSEWCGVTVPFSVNLGGISLSECGSVTMSFPSKHAREKSELRRSHYGEIQRY